MKAVEFVIYLVFFLIRFVCVCVWHVGECLCVWCACVDSCIKMCTGAGQRPTSSIIPQAPSTLCLRQDPLVRLGQAGWLRSSRDPPASISSSHHYWKYKQMPSFLIGYKLRFSCFLMRHLLSSFCFSHVLCITEITLYL